MAKRWTIYNADEDIEAFVKEAEDDQFCLRFHTWHGEREDFKYEKFKTTAFEKLYQSKRAGASTILNMRELRKLYKITLAKFHAESLRNIKTVVHRKENALFSNCSRCLLIALISENVTSSCGISVEFNKEVHERQLLFIKAEIVEFEYVHTLINSVAHGAIEGTPAITINDPPSERIKSKVIHQEPELTYVNEDHVCIHTTATLGPVKVVNMNIKFDNNKPKHLLVYAPPGFGKTVLQNQLFSRGITVLDIDDIPGVNISKLENLLKKSSVLTNRLDLIQMEHIPGIMFVPTHPELLRERNPSFNLSKEDGIFWFEKHNIPPRPNLLLCKIHKTYLTDWFDLKPVQQTVTGTITTSYVEAAFQVLQM